jgi:hypothetical protein
MKKELMVKWVEALRSGKYKQGQRYLNRDNKFCCLGVLCEVLKIAPTDGTVKGTSKRYAGCVSTLPIEAMKASGLNSALGVYNSRECLSLIHENDSGKTFTEIADIIEKEWENL